MFPLGIKGKNVLIFRFVKVELNHHTKIKPLPELIGAYKTTVSKRIHLSGNVWFKWQKSYYDHIIRNSRDLSRIRKYIEANMENWSVDTFN
jgi:hypothetical protein